MARPRADCFAFEVNSTGIGCKCTALSVMECKAGDGDCPFYKPLNVYLDELQRNNGVLNVESAIKNYSSKALKDKRTNK